MHKLTSFMNVAYGQEIHGTGTPHFFNDHECFSEYYGLVLPPTADVVDLGFNIGLQAEILLRKTSGNIYGVEASRRIYQHALGRFADEPRVQLFNVAVSDHAGTAEFIDTDHWGAGSLQFTAGMKHCAVADQYQKYEVTLARLDDLLGDHDNIGLIKLDIEGAELPALEGARRLIAKNRPFMVMEYCHNALSFHFRGQPIVADTLRAYAEEIGYKVYNIYGICLSHPEIWATSILKDTADVFLIPEEKHAHWVEHQLPLYQYRIFDKFLQRMEWPPYPESNLHYGLSALPSRIYEFVNHQPADAFPAHFASQRDLLRARLGDAGEIRQNSQLSPRGKVLLLLIYCDELPAAIRLATSKDVSETELAAFSRLVEATGEPAR